MAKQQQIIQQGAPEHLQVTTIIPIRFGHSLGSINVSFPYCHTLHFNCEKLMDSFNINLKFEMCCQQGQIQLPSISHSPLTLKSSETTFTSIILHFLYIHCYRSGYLYSQWSWPRLTHSSYMVQDGFFTFPRCPEASLCPSVQLWWPGCSCSM